MRRSAKKGPKVKLVVLRHTLDEDAVQDMVDAKKTAAFRSGLSQPKRAEVHVHSVQFVYEAVLMVSVRYSADFFRKAKHQIKVDHNVSEVVLGDGVFPILKRSRLARVISGRRAKNKVELELEEHVQVETVETVHFDHHGEEIKFAHRVNARTIENYPKQVLRNNEPQVRRAEITLDEALGRLEKRMRLDASGVRDLQDEFVTTDVAEIYVPVFEARLVGPKKKVAIMRIDAARKKIL